MTFMTLVITILGLTDLSSNETKAPDPNFTSTFLYKQVYVSFLLGVPLNLFVLYLSLLSKSITGNYKYLLSNCALCEILFLFSLLESNLTHVYVVENNLVYTPFLCSLYRIWTDTFSVCCFNALPMVFINRYCIVVVQKEYIFTNRVILLVCLLVYWPLLYPLLAFTFPQYLVREMFCGHMYWFPFIREFLLIPVGILTLASIFCVIQLNIFLRNHMKTVSVVVEKSKLKDERSLLIAITVEGLLPIISCTPVVLMVIIGALFNNWDEITRPRQIFGITIDMPFLLFSMGLYQFTPVIEPLLTLFCIRQYRRIIVAWLRRHFGNWNYFNRWSWQRNINTVYPENRESLQMNSMSGTRGMPSHRSKNSRSTSMNTHNS